MQYNQCVHDTDCVGDGGVTQYCTADGICLANTPAADLCPDMFFLPQPGPANAVHVGALLDLSRVNNRQVEEVAYKALAFGLEQINNAVQLDGIQPIVLDVCNIGKSPVDADNATRILIEDRKVVAIIGPNNPAVATNMLARIKAASVPVISPAIIDSGIANSASQGLFFRMAPVEIEQGLQMVSQLSTLANGMATSQLGLLSVVNPYGNNVRSKFTAEWQRKDANNRTDKFYSYTEGNQSLLTSTTNMLVAAKPNFVVLIPGGDSIAAITDLSDLPLDPKALRSYVSTTQILASSSARTAELLDLAASGSPALKNHLARITGVAPLSFANSQEGNDFRTSFVAAYPELVIERDLMVGYTYDALFVIGAASGWSKARRIPARS